MVQRAEQLAPDDDFDEDQLPAVVSAAMAYFYLEEYWPEDVKGIALDEALDNALRGYGASVKAVSQPVLAVVKPEPESVVVPARAAAKVVAVKKPKKLKVVTPKFKEIGEVDPAKFGRLLEDFVNRWIGPMTDVGRNIMNVYMYSLPDNRGCWKDDTPTMVDKIRQSLQSLEPKSEMKKVRMLQFLDQFSA